MQKSSKSKRKHKSYLKNIQIADQTVLIGEGNEVHQISSKLDKTLTTQQGLPVSDDQNSLRMGSRGPLLMEDIIFRDKIFHFDHERIPERVVHARGFGAHGYFESYKSLAKITKADPFQKKGKKTPVFVRFSTVAGNKGSADLARDVRGFAVKFYTQEGNWDLVGNNIPVFFIQDAIKFPDLIHAAKDEPDRGFPQAQTAHDNFWDFISLMPESMHMVMWIMSDRAIPRSFRFMEGFGVHTFRFVNAQEKSTFVKFHWKPKLGLQSVVWNEAVKINGADPDFHRRDLWNSIKNNHFPEWELGVQLFENDFVKKFPFDVLDATKIIPEEDVPIQKIGRLILNKCVDNFFAETEQVAFCTQNIIPGIDFTDDPLLQGRNFSYLDTQIKRLGGPNFTHIPINAPKCPLNFFQQDGHMAMINPKGRVNYEPNSFEREVRENPNKGLTSYPEKLSEHKQRIRSGSFSDHYSQARQFYISQTIIEQNHIINALIFELSKVENLVIRTRIIAHLLNIDKSLAKNVAAGLRLKVMPKAAQALKKVNMKLKKSDALSILLNGPKSFYGRKLGILVSDGADASLIKKLQTMIKKENGSIELVAQKIGGVKLSDSRWLNAQQRLDGAPSVLYDAIAIIISSQKISEFINDPIAREFVADAYLHNKFIGYVKDALSLLYKAGIPNNLDKGCIRLDNQTSHHFIKLCRSLRFWEREMKVMQ